MNNHDCLILDLSNKDVKLMNKLREIFNTYDPIGIYEEQSINFDEYDSEIIKIANEFNHSFSIDDFTNKVHSVFVRMFSAEIVGDKEHYRGLAKEVYNLLEKEIEQHRKIL